MTELMWDGKYKDGKKVGPVRIALPFQTVETVNETAQQRQLTLDMLFAGRETEWRNRLIWGDKKYVLPSLLPEFAGKVNLIYIDPPFATGADFSFITTIPESEDSFFKPPSMIEQKAYRDTWGRGLDSYLQWFYETVVLLRELLTEDGSIYIHLDWHIGQYAKVILDSLFGQENFVNEIIWWYYNKFQGNVNHLASNHDLIYWYRKSKQFVFNPQSEEREKPTRQIKRVWDKQKGSIVNLKDESGKVMYQESTHRTIDDVWRISMLQPADQTENLRYPTQKPEVLLERIMKISSNEGDLILDCFCGSGTTAAVAEKVGRRWITCDLGRFAIHTARKRLLSIDNVTPFIVQNLGKYERQAWQDTEFADSTQRANVQLRYRNFILQLYHATPIDGYSWIHGVKDGKQVSEYGCSWGFAPVTVMRIRNRRFFFCLILCIYISSVVRL
jgi:adenine-specific DNA-methyltransferase